MIHVKSKRKIVSFKDLKIRKERNRIFDLNLHKYVYTLLPDGIEFFSLYIGTKGNVHPS